MMHKRINQLLIVVLVVLLAVYIFQKKINSAEECAKAAGVWNELEQTCEQTFTQVIYENLSSSFPLTMNYPESDIQFVLGKSENIENNFYLRGHYQTLLEEATDDKEAVYDRASVYLNMSKMQLLSSDDNTRDENKLVYFAAPFVTQTVGSGVFVYVGLFSYDQQSKNSEHIDSVLLGDRIREEKINFLDNMIRVDFLDYGQGQVFSDYPSEPKEMSLQLLNLHEPGKQAKFKQVKRMHSSWDKNQDGLNDCELDGSCDHTIDYTKVRPE
jgi:hypothetical protein